MINLEKRRVVSSLFPHYGSYSDDSNTLETKEKLSIGTKVNILRSFFRSVVGPIFPDIFIANPYGVDQASGGIFNVYLRYKLRFAITVIVYIHVFVAQLYTCFGFLHLNLIIMLHNLSTKIKVDFLVQV